MSFQGATTGPGTAADDRRRIGERRWRFDRRSEERRTEAVSVATDRRRHNRRMAVDRRVWPDRRLGLGRRGQDRPMRMRLICQEPGCDEKAIVRPAAEGWLCLAHLRRASH